MFIISLIRFCELSNSSTSSLLEITKTIKQKKPIKRFAGNEKEFGFITNNNPKNTMAEIDLNRT